MRKPRPGLGFAAVSLFWSGWILFSATSFATLPIQQKAKELGFPAAKCTYCHNEALPKKGAATHNERGNWLIAEKAKRNAKEVDPAWLKDYPGGEK